MGRLGEAYGEALSAQRAIIRAATTSWDGREMGTEGDSFFVVFSSARPGAALQGSGEQACPCGELDRDGAAIGRCRCAASEGRTLTIPSSAEPGVVSRWAMRAAGHRLPGSAWRRAAIFATRLPTISAGLRAFSPRFPLTQRHAVYLHNLEADLRPIRRDWVGQSSLQVPGSRSPRGSIRPQDGHIVLALTRDMRHERALEARTIVRIHAARLPGRSRRCEQRGLVQART